MTLQSELAISYDAQALGIMGLSGALIAVAIAAKDFLEHWWWISLIPLSASIFSCALALYAADLERGLDPTDPGKQYEHLDEDAMDEVIAKNLHRSYLENRFRLEFKHDAIHRALRILGATVVVAAVLGAVVS